MTIPRRGNAGVRPSDGVGTNSKTGDNSETGTTFRQGGDKSETVEKMPFRRLVALNLTRLDVQIKNLEMIGRPIPFSSAKSHVATVMHLGSDECVFDLGWR